MYKFYISLLIFILSFSNYAQENVLLKGKIQNKNLGEISINIINLTQKTGTTNAQNGNFQIEVEENDTLLFSSIQYDKLKSVVFQKIF